jgi:hypothetical protein
VRARGTESEREQEREKVSESDRAVVTHFPSLSHETQTHTERERVLGRDGGREGEREIGGKKKSD